MNAPDLVAALAPVVAAFESLGVSYRIGGSVASSAMGVPRTTLDVDLVCDLRDAHVAPLVARLGDSYYADADTMHDAVRRRSAFNLIHLSTMLKVDVFVLKDRAYDREAFSRPVRRVLSDEAGAQAFEFASPEDVVLNKLEWYRTGGESSERQWSDVLGVLRVQGPALDTTYLDRWGDALGIRDLLDRARAEAS